MSKILFVTDNRALLKRVNQIAIDEGFDLFHTKTFEDSVQAFRKFKPSLAVIDVCLSTRPGFDIAKDFVTEESETRVIMLSNLDTNLIRNLAIRSGARDLLVKPFSDSELIFTIRHYMEDSNETST